MGGQIRGKKLQRLEGLQEAELRDLVREAEKVYYRRETEEEKEQRKEKEREEREERRDRRQEKNLTKILAAVVEGKSSREREEREERRDRRQEKNLTKILAAVVEGTSSRERERDFRKIRSGPRQSGNLGNRTPLDKDQCAYCKEKGHWARNCPKKGNKGPKVLALEEDKD